LESNQLILEKDGVSQSKVEKQDSQNNLVGSRMSSGTRYVVVDCGGGTIDVTIHEIHESDSTGYLKELYKASGGPFGSMIVDLEFEKLLKNIFSKEFIDEFIENFPASYNSLMSTFESKKRSVCFDNPPNYLNINLPYSFIDFYKKKSVRYFICFKAV
jgi:molecular chaperone DnaK (HSP70)